MRFILQNRFWFVSQNPKNLMRFILQNRFWFVLIPLDSMDKYQLLAQFPVNHLPHPVVYYHYYYYNLLLFHSWKFFTPTLADDFSLEFDIIIIITTTTTTTSTTILGDSWQARLANLHLWVRVSLDSPFNRPCAISKEKKLSKLL